MKSQAGAGDACNVELVTRKREVKEPHEPKEETNKEEDADEAHSRP